MVVVDFNDIDHQQMIIDARTHHARLLMEWFSLRDVISLQTVLFRNSDIKIHIGYDEAMMYRFNILNFACDKEDITGWMINYRLGENEFAKYVAPKIAEMLNEEGF